MKKSISVILSLLFLTVAIADGKYETEMKKNLDKISECKTSNDYLKLANVFERIATAEKDKWLPYYYGSFVAVLASYADSSKITKDIYLDKADKFLNVADSLSPENSEIYTLKGMISQARMQVDPMNRWQKYGAEATNNFTKAMQADSLNPRPEYLIGVGLFYTPQQFGGGPKTAKPVLEKSLMKFEQFVPENDIMPSWGKEQVEEYLKQINESK
ncbi:MAG: hypothetical protein ABI638_11015 [Ignavibacteriota bacterium]